MTSITASAPQLLRRQLESALRIGRLSVRPLQRKTTSTVTIPRARFSTRRGAAPPHKPSPFSHRNLFQQRFSSTTTQQSTKDQPHSLSQRLKKLSREYGWSALGVYLALSALDFPFCFAAVRLVGVERIGYLEHTIMSWIKGTLGQLWPLSMKPMHEHKENADEHGVLAAERRNVEEGASIWTQLALAYAIHKSFIFLRVPLTAAVTPKVVHTLRRWGWNIGKRTPKSK